MLDGLLTFVTSITVYHLHTHDYRCLVVLALNSVIEVPLTYRTFVFMITSLLVSMAARFVVNPVKP